MRNKIIKALQWFCNVIRKYKLMLLWTTLVIYLLFDLNNDLSIIYSETLRWEAYLFYFLILMYLSFPLGMFLNIIFIIIFNLLDLAISIEYLNKIDILITTLCCSIGFYIQWYILFPKLIKFINRRKM